MSDPRKKVSHEGVATMPLTFAHDGSIVYDMTKAGGSASVGKPVTLVGAGTVGIGANGTRVEGRLEKVEPDGFCGVNTEGGMTLPAAAPIANGAKIVNAGGGLIRAAVEPGAAYAEGSADDVSQARGIVEDGSVAAAIQVFLR